MTDVILKDANVGDATAARTSNDNGASKADIAIIELLFFAYRDFIADPDAILESYGFGRAHHRVLHFVNRNPGMAVAELLDILKITKQSLGRVLKQLIDQGFIEQRTGPRDRRQRLLYPTETGEALARRLIEPQLRRVRDALASLPEEQRGNARAFLAAMVDDHDRALIAKLIKS